MIFMANYKTDLKNYIKNLKKFRNSPAKVYRKAILEVIFATLYYMSELTVVDTGQARYLLISFFAEHYNFRRDELDDLYDQYYGYWKQIYGDFENRGWGNNSDKVNYNTSSDKNNFNLNIKIKDDGLYNQEYTGYISNKVPKRDNAQFVPRHITYVSDLVNNGKFDHLDKLDYKKMVEDLCGYIEKMIFTGQVD